MADQKRDRDLEQELAGYFAPRPDDARAADETVRRIAGLAPAVAAPAPQRSSALPVFAAAAVVVLAVSLGYWLVAAPRGSAQPKRTVAGETEKPKPNNPEPPPAIPSQEMLDAAKLAYEGSVMAYDRGLVGIEEVYTWSCRWQKAAHARAANTDEQKVLADEHCKRMESLLELANKQERAGRVTKRDVYAATYYAQEAQLGIKNSAYSPVGTRLQK